MEILQVQIDKIKPDLNQPRKVINQFDLEDLAQGIKTEGVINPIEIDRTFTIITGERRWRAAKLAGLQAIPCFFNDLKGKERFKHQVIENAHHNTMTDMDMAEALSRLLKDYGLLSPGKSKTGRGGRNETGITWLSKEIGKSLSYIEEKLSLLEQDEEFKSAVQENKVPATMVRAIKRCPEPFKKKLTEKILSGDFQSRDGALEIATRLEYEPEKADVLLDKSYKGMSTSEVITFAKNEAPTYDEQLTDDSNARLSKYKLIRKLANQLHATLSENPLNDLNPSDRFSTTFHLDKLGKAISKYLEGQEIPKIVEMTGEIIN